MRSSSAIAAACIISVAGFCARGDRANPSPSRRDFELERRGACKSRRRSTAMLSIFLATNAVALPSSSALLKVLASGALLSRPPRGVVSLSGPDARRLLHQQSSNAIEGTAANTVLDTAVLNGQGRIRDLVTAAVLPDELLVVTGVAADLAKVFDLYIFPADDVAAADASADWSVLALAGGRRRRDGGRGARFTAGGGPAGGIARRRRLRARWPGSTRRGARCSCAAAPTPTACGRARGAARRRRRVGGGRRAAQRAARPADPRRRASTDFNPLEAALWRAVSFTKGCHIGQETIARLQQDPEVRVKQQLFGPARRAGGDGDQALRRAAAAVATRRRRRRRAAGSGWRAW